MQQLRVIKLICNGHVIGREVESSELDDLEIYHIGTTLDVLTSAERMEKDLWIGTIRGAPPICSTRARELAQRTARRFGYEFVEIEHEVPTVRKVDRFGRPAPSDEERAYLESAERRRNICIMLGHTELASSFECIRQEGALDFHNSP